MKTVPNIIKSNKIRNMYENSDLHIPPFLIASITSQCNLRCAGCYARSNGSCNDHSVNNDMTAEHWKSIFQQSNDLGISFILLAGGEPLLRRDIIYTASDFKEIIFPVFTNGTMIDEKYLDLFDNNRNLIPVLSIEGDTKNTDKRRGNGTYDMVTDVMDKFNKRNILFGVSITVTKENMAQVTGNEFISDLVKKGCGLTVFVEYVPTDPSTQSLVLSDNDISYMEERVTELKKYFSNNIFLSFPGDEKFMGGCLASGRGFFHINSKGGAEPCPFSPYSKYNLKTSSVIEVLRSEFFIRMRELAASEEHNGGCTLFNVKDQVENIVSLLP